MTKQSKKREKDWIFERSSQAGQVVIVVAVGMLALVGLTALAIDVGYIQHEKALLQNAADSAAIAAAWALSEGQDWQSAGLNSASLNGFTNGVNGVSVSLNQPTSGQYAGSQYVQAVVALNQPTFFMRAFGIDSLPLAATAIAEVGNNRSCVFILDPSAAGALTVNTGASLDSRCGIIVNSASNQALELSTGGDITAPWIGLGSSAPEGPLPANTHYPIAPVADPLASLAPPSFSNENPNPSTSSCSQPGFVLAGSQQKQITPCTYTTTIRVSGNSNLTFASGNYTLAGGLVVSGASVATLNPGNYTIQGGITVSSSAQINLGSGSYYIQGGLTVSTAASATLGAGNYFIQGPLASSNCRAGALLISTGANASLGSGNYVIEGGIAVSSGSSLVLGSGTYVLEGGGMTVCSGGTLTGSGVTFYNTQNGSSYPYQGIDLATGSKIFLTAPTSGPLAGILFFQDRSVGVGGPPSIMNTGANGTFEGALYFPTTSLQYSSGADAAYTIIVADTLTMSSGSSINNDYSSLAYGSPIKQAILVQ